MSEVALAVVFLAAAPASDPGSAEYAEIVKKVYSRWGIQQTACGHQIDCIAQCEAGDADACEWLYAFFSRLGDHRRHRALRHLSTLSQKQCESEGGEGCLRLGILYQVGLGVKRDAVEARRLIQKAMEQLLPRCFEQQDARTCLLCGRMANAGLWSGDRGGGFLALELGCVLGEVEACTAAAELASADTGVRQNDQRAGTLRMLGANHRRCQPPHPNSCLELAKDLLDYRWLAVARQQGQRLLERECERDSGRRAASCLELGRRLRAGHGTKRNLEAARVRLGQACRLRSRTACAQLGDMLLLGEGGPTDEKRARALLEEACRWRNEWACTRAKEPAGQPAARSVAGLRRRRLERTHELLRPLDVLCHEGVRSACIERKERALFELRPLRRMHRHVFDREILRHQQLQLGCLAGSCAACEALRLYALAPADQATAILEKAEVNKKTRQRAQLDRSCGDKSRAACAELEYLELYEEESCSR